MSAGHYWLGRIHGMLESTAIVESCLRVGMDLPTALETVEQIADEIRFEMGQDDKQMLAARVTWEDLQELPVDLFQQIGRPT